jgi:polyribonucleotide nucleotidyltransferase
VQIVVTPLSADGENDIDVISLIGASAALSISDIPFAGPVAAVRVGYIDGEFVINPTIEQMNESALDLAVAGTAESVLMVEAGANISPRS